MSYMSLVAPCGNCGTIFSSNPSLVPSINNTPICKACIEVANPQREALGLAPFRYHPDAYEPKEEA
jgi:hypothetical protein